MPTLLPNSAIVLLWTFGWLATGLPQPDLLAAPVAQDKKPVLSPQVADPDRAPLLPIPNLRAGELGPPNPDLQEVRRQTWPAELSHGEKVALQTYANEAFTVLNPALRTSGTVPASHARLHQRIQSAFMKAQPFRYRVEVVRFIQLDGPALDKFLAMIETSQRSGVPFVLKGYVSTSVGTAAGFDGNLEFHIRAVHGLDLMPVSLFPQEKELLLNHDSRFQTIAMRRVGKRHVIDCEQLMPSRRNAKPRDERSESRGPKSWLKRRGLDADADVDARNHLPYALVGGGGFAMR
jgi:hypothetical protein